MMKDNKCGKSFSIILWRDGMYKHKLKFILKIKKLSFVVECAFNYKKLFINIALVRITFLISCTTANPLNITNHTIEWVFLKSFLKRKYLRWYKRFHWESFTEDKTFHCTTEYSSPVFRFTISSSAQSRAPPVCHPSPVCVHFIWGYLRKRFNWGFLREPERAFAVCDVASRNNVVYHTIHM